MLELPRVKLFAVCKLSVPSKLTYGKPFRLEVETNLGLKEEFTEEKLFPEPVRLFHEVTSFPEV